MVGWEDPEDQDIWVLIPTLEKPVKEDRQSGSSVRVPA
jgi:hypothetical protein